MAILLKNSYKNKKILYNINANEKSFAKLSK